MFWGVTCTHRIFWFQKIKQWLIRTVRQLNCLNCPVPFLLRQVCAQHVSLEELQIAPFQRSQEHPDVESQDKLQVSILWKLLIYAAHRRSMEKHTCLRPPYKGDNSFCVQKLPLVLTQNQSLPFQKVFHMKNTISKFVFTFPVLIVPSFLLLTDCNFPRFLLKFFP